MSDFNKRVLSHIRIYVHRSCCEIRENTNCFCHSWLECDTCDMWIFYHEELLWGCYCNLLWNCLCDNKGVLL